MPLSTLGVIGAGFKLHCSRFLKFGEVITANSEKKITLLSRNMINKACQVNFDKMNIETCLFLLKVSNREEDNFSYRVKKNTNSKSMSESCINDEIISVNV